MAPREARRNEYVTYMNGLTFDPHVHQVSHAHAAVIVRMASLRVTLVAVRAALVVATLIIILALVRSLAVTI